MSKPDEVCQKSDTQTKQKPKRDWKAINARRRGVKAMEMTGSGGQSRDLFWKGRHINRILDSGMVPEDVAKEIRRMLTTFAWGKSRPLISIHAAYKLCRAWEYAFITKNMDLLTGEGEAS